MKKYAILLCALLLSSTSFAKAKKAEFNCGKKYTAVSCANVKEANRTHLCLKHPKKLTEKNKKKWCMKKKRKAKKVSKK